MVAFAVRFRRTAVLIAALAAVLIVAAIVAGFVIMPARNPSGSVALWAVALALTVAAAVQFFISRSRSTALRRAISANPDGAVFLARRQPALVSDLAVYVSDPEVYDQVSDRWVVASIGERGMSAWSVGRDAHELLTIPWDQIGPIEPIDLESGRPGIAVDVKPFPTPLVVSVGYAAYGVLAPFGARGVAEVVATADALRPHSG